VVFLTCVVLIFQNRNFLKIFGFNQDIICFNIEQSIADFKAKGRALGGRTCDLPGPDALTTWRRGVRMCWWTHKAICVFL